MNWLKRNLRNYVSDIKSTGAQPAIGNIALISSILAFSPGCIVVGGYSSERGWFLWPGTMLIFVVGAVLLLLFRRRK
ncbi:MAG TPA: hypothetical protein VJU86_01600 [Pyrinomonadaceae bacterium]|nr:hypothetical protein [Pyrinomonadaceae bacterium]